MQPIIICFECRKRITPEDITGGLHNHADWLESQPAPFDPAVNAED